MTKQLGKDYITPGECAKLLGVSVHTLAAWRTAKKVLPFYKLGIHVYYKKDEALEAYSKNNPQKLRKIEVLD